MKTDFYTYCILKYKHSPYLDESINIGVLIYFEESKKFVFKYSKALNRIKSIYCDVPEKTIKEYIRQISKYLDGYRSEDTIFNSSEGLNLKSFISANILPDDSTVIQFCNFKTEPTRGLNEELIEKIILEKEFIDDIKGNLNQQQEPKIISHLYTELKKYGLENVAFKNRYKKDFNIQTNTGNFHFDFAWKNGVWNLVKPVGFDLKTPEGIIQKARNNLGEFTDFKSEVSETDYKCNLIVGEPIDHSLFKNYESALSILHKIPNIKIIEESMLKDYSQEIIEALSKSDI
ncbi:DUF3037 domain-containing protein [Flavobacterium cerinum]|uniref:DUF3037 domain-containing protein n=1 Tax=Flavobacterium cerinum TaxID=2502784 RepID=A0ABY5IYQ0_9FLAO|nr:DUF3037 domain-containing protein [Flavobacterium cerinum]UUC47287.1 DUF3037 domain-containing protein [Flavobacterium cerinum]